MTYGMASYHILETTVHILTKFSDAIDTFRPVSNISAEFRYKLRPTCDISFD